MNLTAGGLYGPLAERLKGPANIGCESESSFQCFHSSGVLTAVLPIESYSYLGNYVVLPSYSGLT